MYDDKITMKALWRWLALRKRVLQKKKKKSTQSTYIISVNLYAIYVMQVYKMYNMYMRNFPFSEKKKIMRMRTRKNNENLLFSCLCNWNKDVKKREQKKVNEI